MDRRSIIKMPASLACWLLVLLRGTRTSHIRWRLASSFPKSLDTIFGAAEVFAKK